MDGIVLLAKRSGCTSFSALWQVKNSLETKKIGHTGTLDSFADGLLVVLAGRYTHLVPYITNCDKEYIARMHFGYQTETLDPLGKVVSESPLPSLYDLKKAFTLFNGQIDQVPPAYSAIHIQGQRASDRIRRGEEITLPSRKVIIRELELLSYQFSTSSEGREQLLWADIRVLCSKGTYIRSLARDIAQQAGSSATLTALRRTRIGPFSLEAAAGFSSLPEFGTSYEEKIDICGEIREQLLGFTKELSGNIGIRPVQIHTTYEKSFLNGQLILLNWFDLSMPLEDSVFSVFSGSRFLGVFHKQGTTLGYDFVYREEP